LEELRAHQRRCHAEEDKEPNSMLETVLIVVLVLALLGALPRWGHSREWGYGPSGLLGTVLVIVLIIFLLQRI
jgi:hypothetical protein